MKKLIMKKLTSKKGETITEVLVAVLVIVLGLTMLAAMINSSSKLMITSRSYYDEFYKAENALETAKPENAVSTPNVVFQYGSPTNRYEVPVNLYASTQKNPESEEDGFTFYRYQVKKGD